MKKIGFLIIIFLIIVIISTLYISIAQYEETNSWMVNLHLVSSTFIIIITSLYSVVLLKNYEELKIRAKKIDNFNNLHKEFIDADDRLIYLKDENLKYVFANKALEKYYNKNTSEVIGKDDFDLSDREFAEIRVKSDLEVLHKLTDIETMVTWNNRIYKTNKFPIMLLNGSYGVGAYIEDLTEENNIKLEKEKADDEIKYLSYHDSLTGLYNRMFFEQELKRLDTERNLPISIIMGDVNGLKLTNDIFGHAAGDNLLKKVAEIYKNIFRADDIIARVGGDEFVVLLPKTSAEVAEKIITRIKNELSKEQIVAVRSSISMGNFTKENVEQDIVSIMEDAETKMYQEKTLNQKNISSNQIKTIIKTLHGNSPREEKHSKNVSELCEDIGRAMKLSNEEIKRLKDAGYLHDIGKIVSSKDTINNCEYISEQEKKKINQHPVVGYRILNSFDDTLDLAESVLSHHEYWDGSGYPKGLKGEEIPKLARIISVADSFDSLANDMNKNVISKEEALKLINKQSGVKYDPEIVDIFVDLMLDKI